MSNQRDRRGKDRRKIVLYFPKMSGITVIPLALLAVARFPEQDGFDVKILDGNYVPNRLETVLEETRDAVCLGISVYTGDSITDAVRLSRAVRRRLPSVPIVWGGWHPSLFPEQCVREADIIVIGQGERSFGELATALSQGSSWDHLPGIAYQRGEDTVINPARGTITVDSLPPYPYHLIDIDRYARDRTLRLIDYVSSYGCPFNCSFCATQVMTRGSWSALSAERMVNELMDLKERYAFDGISFLDDNFFASRERAIEFADRIVAMQTVWQCSARISTFLRLEHKALAKLRISGLSRVFFGAESGFLRTLRHLRKDHEPDDILSCAGICRRHGIAPDFSFMVGFPNEPSESIHATIQMVKHLKSTFPESTAQIFFYSPYPGTDLYDIARQSWVGLPDSLETWAQVGDHDACKPWLDAQTMKQVKSVEGYCRIAYSASQLHGIRNLIASLVRRAARFRLRYDMYALPIELLVAARRRARRSNAR